jgi:hemerythrin
MQTAWNPSLATGINTVDREHQEIFRQAALLTAAMKEGKGRDELKNIVDFVDDYIVTHFINEEKVMDEYRCPAAGVNKAAHTQFIKAFKDLKDKFNAAGASTSLVLDISTMINNWLVQHIKQIDFQLGKCQNTDAKKPAFAGR